MADFIIVKLISVHNNTIDGGGNDFIETSTHIESVADRDGCIKRT